MNAFDFEKLDVYETGHRTGLPWPTLRDRVSGDSRRLQSRYTAGRELLLRIVSMLVQMVRRIVDTGTGTGTGTK